MSDWKETKSEHPESPTTNKDQEHENMQDKTTLEELDRLRKEEEQELAEDKRKRDEEHRLLLSPTMKSAVQGYSDVEDGGDDPSIVRDEISGVDDPSPEIDEREKGIAPLSDETKIELERIKNLPVEQRQKAMGDFFHKQQDILGNMTPEGKNMQLDAKVHPGGMGVTITDKDGIKYVIDYED
jgi:hypothetical protein